MLALVAAALVGGLFIGRALAPSPTQPVRTIERFVLANEQGLLPSTAQELASIKAAYGRNVSGQSLRAHGLAATVTSVPAPAPVTPASVHNRQLAP